MIESIQDWRGGREAEGAGLLNRYTDVYPYRGFESLPLRHVYHVFSYVIYYMFCDVFH